MNERAGYETHGWQYHNRLYKEHAGDPEWLVKEALRRAVDIRDQGTGRGTMLVDVLNMLSDALGYETYSELWVGWDS
jgi:hypothetical protein